MAMLVTMGMQLDQLMEHISQAQPAESAVEPHPEWGSTARAVPDTDS
jgi:hypothetical protein